MLQAARTKLSLKLLVPLVLCGLAVVFLMSLVTWHLSAITSERLVRQQATEYLESFLMAVEVNSSRSSVIRTVNSLGTYQGISEILIVDQPGGKVIAANKSKYVGHIAGDLPAVYQGSGSLQQVLSEGGEVFSELNGDQFIFAYRTNILSEDRMSINPIVISMLLTADGISGFFRDFTAAMQLALAPVFIGAIVVFYLILKFTLLNRIERIVDVIRDGSLNGEARICPVDSKDELGTLVLAYNNAVLSEHEHKKDLIAMNEALHELSHADALTGVSNRRNFDRVFLDEWGRAMRQQQFVAVLMLDVDYFKDFNDRYGHPAGDACLHAVAQALHQQLKRSGDLLSRYGGEEFAIILPATGDDCIVVAESCRRAIEELEIDIGPEYEPARITISIGAAHTVPQRGAPREALLELADQALYQAKQNGRNRVVSFEPGGSEKPETSSLPSIPRSSRA
jgi:diguanylate cyclase (GGDEF)-like protein